MRLPVLSVAFLLCACGEKTRPEKPFILADRASLGYGLETAEAVYIGQSKKQTLQISNEGTTDLKIESITVSGDNVFSIQPLMDPPITVKGAQHTFIQAFFAPKAVRTCEIMPVSATDCYIGDITIVSNADNQKTLHVALSGSGLNP